MKRDYFEYKGKKYYTGTKIMVKDYGKIDKATFIYYDTEQGNYVYKIGDGKWFVYEKKFYEWLVEVLDEVDPTVKIPVEKQLKDRYIDGLFIGWLWYVFLMAVATIFNGNVILWILISVVFFNWRKNKIKKEGTYTEW